MKTSTMMRCLDMLLRLAGDQDISIRIKDESEVTTTYPINNITYASGENGVEISNINYDKNTIIINTNSDETK